jgi:hypothetical protein
MRNEYLQTNATNQDDPIVFWCGLIDCDSNKYVILDNMKSCVEIE